MALKPVKLSQKLELAGVPRYLPTKGTKDYGFICDPQKYAVDLHYEDGLGTFQCFGGSCCDKLGEPRTSHIYLVAFYQGNERKNLKGPLTIKHLRASYALDNFIRSIIEDLDDENEICKKDFIFQLDESSGEQFKKISMAVCPDGKRLATPEMLADLGKKLPIARQKLSNSIAPEWTEEQFALKWATYCEEKGIDSKKTTVKQGEVTVDQGEIEVDDSGDLEDSLMEGDALAADLGEQSFDDIDLGLDVEDENL